jgi:hypothetical protein
LSIPEIRKSLIDDGPLEVCVYSRFLNAGAPDSRYSGFDNSEYLAYLYKNFFRFMSCSKQGPVQGAHIYYGLVPYGFLQQNTEQTKTEKDTALRVRITDNEHFFWYNEAEGEEL